MKDEHDQSTPDMLTKRGRGRPRKVDAMSEAERARGYRQRKRDRAQQAADNPDLGMRWWNSLTRIDRAWWCGAANSARPADAFAAYVRKHGLPDL